MRIGGSGRRVVGLLAGAAVAMGLVACVADPPPVMGIAAPGNARATVSWERPPVTAPGGVVAYEVQAYSGSVGLPVVRFESAATTQTITGLTNGTTYTFHVRAIDTSGNDSAWSEASNPVVPGPPLALDGGGIHTCVVLTDGTAKCWGVNDSGQLGDGTTTDSFAPVAVAGLTGATDISAGGEYHTCALLAGGGVKCWGRNGNGQLGNGTTIDSLNPVSVTGITTAVAISAGTQHTCALLADRSIRCWGLNVSGELGDGTTTNSLTPVTVTGISTATAISAGDFHTCALLAGGAPVCWGYNHLGRLGDGTTTHSSTPVAVAGIPTATAISAGGAHTCALVGGGVACWGANPFGQLGDGTSNNSLTQVTVTGITNATAIGTGGAHSCALLATGTIKCWGDNFSGELGNGTTTDSPTPVTVTGISTATAIRVGGYHTCSLLADGTIKCWGNQLANGTPNDAATPTVVAGL